MTATLLLLAALGTTEGTVQTQAAEEGEVGAAAAVETETAPETEIETETEAAAKAGAETQAATGTEAAREPAIFAIVVGHNRSLDEETAALRYADDDSARFYELMTTIEGATVELLAELDGETQETFVGLADRAKSPTAANIKAAMDRMVKGIAAAKAAGRATQLYFYFAGHGDVGDDREGYLNLRDGKFSRSSIFREVIGRSEADLNHIIIDACNSYFVINRGADDPDAARDAIASFLQQESLDQYPNTGVVLSTATEAASHEWSRYRSGIFSHQLLSALWGAGDVDADGRISYDELGAYVAAANYQVQDPRARLSIFSRAPRTNRGAPLLEHGDDADVGIIRVPQSMAGHYYLEDDRGVRFAEFNKTSEQPLRIAMLKRPFYYLRSESHEVRIDWTDEVDVGTLELTPNEAQSRGTLEQSFRRHLFAYPFGMRFFAGHKEAQRLASPDVVRVVKKVTAPVVGPDLQPWAWGSAVVSVAGIATGVILQILANQSSGRLNAGGLTQAESVAVQREALGLQTGAGVSFGLGIASAATAVILFVLDRLQPSEPAADP